MNRAFKGYVSDDALAFYGSYGRSMVFSGFRGTIYNFSTVGFFQAHLKAHF